VMSELHVLTGAPGAGKTAILDAVGPAVRRVREPARAVLAEQRSAGDVGTPDRDPSLFVDLLLRRSIADHRAAERAGVLALFDRGVPDCVAYARMLDVDARAAKAAEAFRYHPEVLVAAPWEAIYAVDDERTMSFAGTARFHAAIVDAYERAGYALLPVPRDSVGRRAAFVRDAMGVGDGGS